MTFEVYFHHALFSYRVYLNSQLKEKELKNLVLYPHESKGAGIKAYPPIIGTLLSIIGIATVWKTQTTTYYLNTQSLKKFFYRMFLITPSKDQLLTRIQLFILQNKFPPSPVLEPQGKDCFRINSRMWIISMHNRYKELKIKGYDSKIMSLLSENFLVKTLSQVSNL